MKTFGTAIATKRSNEAQRGRSNAASFLLGGGKVKEAGLGGFLLSSAASIREKERDGMTAVDFGLYALIDELGQRTGRIKNRPCVENEAAESMARRVCLVLKERPSTEPPSINPVLQGIVFAAIKNSGATAFINSDIREIALLLEPITALKM